MDVYIYSGLQIPTSIVFNFLAFLPATTMGGQQQKNAKLFGHRNESSSVDGY